MSTVLWGARRHDVVYDSDDYYEDHSPVFATVPDYPPRQAWMQDAEGRWFDACALTMQIRYEP